MASRGEQGRAGVRAVRRAGFFDGLGQWACQEAAGREKLVKTPAPAQEVGVSRRRPLARAPCLRGSEFFRTMMRERAEKSVSCVCIAIFANSQNVQRPRAPASPQPPPPCTCTEPPCVYKKYSRAQVRVVVGQGAKGGASTRRLQATHKVGAMLGGRGCQTLRAEQCC